MQNRFVREVRKARLPARQDANYAEALRSLHSSILGLCALVESFPYSVEPWMPALTDGTCMFGHEISVYVIEHGMLCQFYPPMQLIPHRYRLRFASVPLNSKRYGLL